MADTFFDVPLVFYFEIADGRAADLEIVSKSSLEAIALVRDISFIFDPSSEIRMKLISGDEGSLRLNTLISGKKLKRSAKMAAIGAGFFLAEQTLGYLYTAILDGAVDHVQQHLFDEENQKPNQNDWNLFKGEKIPPNEQREISERLIKVCRDKSRKQYAEQFFVQLSRDENIRAFGLTPKLRTNPAKLLDRGDFTRIASGGWDEARSGQRERIQRIRAILVRPVLLDEVRNWRFRSIEGEFSAKMADRRFLKMLLAGEMKTPLMAGLEIEMTLSTSEIARGEVWEVDSRVVVEVHSVKPPSQQKEMTL